jgi:hypothetical protein
MVGGMARLEGSGVLFLRSLCRLTHVGHAQYYKGDGHAFHDYLETHYPGFKPGLSSLNSHYPELTLTLTFQFRVDKQMRGQGGTLKATRLVA